MGCHQHDHALTGQIAEHVAYGMRCTRIQLGGRLINQQHAWSGTYRARVTDGNTSFDMQNLQVRSCLVSNGYNVGYATDDTEQLR